MKTAIDILIDKIKQAGCPICVGLDPTAETLPPELQEIAETEGIPAAFLAFNKALLDTLSGLVPCCKPQIAMYERYGAAGVKAYIETVAYASSKGFSVIGDVKRGDISTVASAYAEGHLGNEFNTDFATVNPFMGRDVVLPFMDACKKYNKGIFVLVKTSNPGSADIQDLDIGGEKVYERLGSMVEDWSKELLGEYGYSNVGAVVGATWPEQASSLRKRMPHVFFLIPGYGAQGGTAGDVSACFDENGLGGVINSSRGIIAAWKKPEYSGVSFTEAARVEVLRMKADLGRVIHVR